MSNKGIEHYLEAAERSQKWHLENKAKMKKCRFDTIAVHGIYSMQEALDFNQGSTIEPIYMSASQAYRDSDEMEAALSYQIPTWCYSRIGNPSMYYLEGVLALIESYGTDVEASCCATSSGMSAIQSACDPFLVVDKNYPNDKMNFVATAQVYGGTFQQFAIRKDQEKNIEWKKIINSNDINEWESQIDENTRFLYGEMPSNPGLSFFDLEKVVQLAHKYNLPMIVDATVATPALMRPLAYGADIVIQSVTKTLSSSGFGIAGALISRKNITSKIDNPLMKEDFATYIKALPNRDNGPNISPMNAILTLNDIRTLRSKIDLMSRSTLKIAKYIENHKHIEKVDYLGLESHPLHELAKKYLVLVDSEHDELYNEKVNRFGHLMSFRVKGGAKETRKVFDAFERIWRATDLGRIKSVATIPSISTHSQQGEEGRKLADIPPNLIRLCVGAEHPDDIINDIKQALEVLDGKKITYTSPEFSAGGASSATLQRS
ncbi:MAG: O-acetylhomoserine aminocarboxypropyltransferase/cysteine synthase [Bacteroidetes bacterium]|jgi:O-acetylhomoserine/O-acetylserine sulfhydrylase-like pyridoxal-dependent enzyme|nr:O-acetylhomoserine aminocarboxypropyltransferase/cysteine synthase [Bacteroidota bacterium]MBT6686014.1 O-acetylhomoserine aminocarboxypropyltransferase/cysteine synthase [Bacteroidota bacterium]MBT7142306.1 O-acetylhomoserine aminocarboxypropyltransferase/cysteine synthase [Bacteroidota bacterium]MBT7492670.1 O-acetylhomoserine aminocarboxypropyltransferase/cysteine synthase [Bacteroidota bacterium]